MKDYFFNIEQIQNFLTLGKATEALELTIKLLENDVEEPDISLDLMCAALLIDCGTELDNLNAVNFGIEIIIYYIENIKDVSEKDLVTLHYNLSNGY